MSTIAGEPPAADTYDSSKVSAGQSLPGHNEGGVDDDACAWIGVGNLIAGATGVVHRFHEQRQSDLAQFQLLRIARRQMNAVCPGQMPRLAQVCRPGRIYMMLFVECIVRILGLLGPSGDGRISHNSPDPV